MGIFVAFLNTVPPAPPLGGALSVSASQVSRPGPPPRGFRVSRPFPVLRDGGAGHFPLRPCSGMYRGRAGAGAAGACWSRLGCAVPALVGEYVVLIYLPDFRFSGKVSPILHPHHNTACQVSHFWDFRGLSGAIPRGCSDGLKHPRKLPKFNRRRRRGALPGQIVTTRSPCPCSRLSAAQPGPVLLLSPW